MNEYMMMMTTKKTSAKKFPKMHKPASVKAALSVLANRRLLLINQQQNLDSCNELDCVWLRWN